MIWLTWRQQRTELLLAVGLLGLLAAILVVTGLEMQGTYHSLGIGACVGTHPAQDCNTVIQSFEAQYSNITGLIGWLNFVPLLLGFLLGAPFVLEMEMGTYRLAWTQSISRTRWIAIKLLTIVVLAIVLGLAFDLLMTWWRMPLDHISTRLDGDAFDFEGIAPIAYTLFAVSLGTAAGALLRKVIPAIAVSTGLFLLLRLSVLGNLRANYQAPLQSVSATGGFPIARGSGQWILSSGWATPAGVRLSDHAVFNICPPNLTNNGSKSGLEHCLATHHVYTYVLYQPASRFWTFQGIEAAIFGVAALLLFTLTIWMVKRRT